ncbi:MAG: molybdopterin cofactor-binding domain-containing protein [Chloroflexia bacterium]
MEEETITLTVNGVEREVRVGPRTTLLEVLREELGLTGTKNGCGQGHCGACTVLVDGQAVRSCIYLARRAAGRRVLTIEGLAPSPWGQEGGGEGLHPLQQAFIDQGAVQCGFCTPGMIMAALALLQQSPRPGREEILLALEPNLCRCTGYSSIVRAVLQASGQLPPPAAPPPTAPLRTIGRSLPRPDVRAKVTGRARYAADLRFEGLLYAAVLRSAHPHARILRLDVERARTMPGVVAVLTADDIPGRRTHGVLRPDWPVLVGVGEKVRYIGDALAVVVAETPAQAEEARAAVAVEYEVLPGVFSPEAALAEGAPQVHEGGNLLKHIRVRKGDVAAGLAQAEVIVEETFRTPTVEHAFLEPEAAVAVPELAPGQEGVTVYVGSQIPFADREQVAASLSLPLERVRVVQTAVGGAFGGKEDISVQIHAALAAWKTGRPVKLVLSREESIRVHPKRHATTIHLRVGATREGRLTAVQAEIYGDAGAYASLSEAVMTRTATHAAGPYIVPNVAVDCYAAYTNNPPSGAMRGFGVPQATFAIETALDMLAEKVGLHPLELRRRNALRPGATTATGQLLRESVGLLETIDRVEEAVRSLGEEVLLPSGPDRRRAWGFACCMKNVGLGGGVPDSAGATVLVTEEGRLSVRIGAAEVGQGVVSIAAQIAAEVLGVPLERVDMVVGDTLLTPDGGATTASRQTFVTGNAVQLAAEEVRAILAGAASEALDCPPDRLAFVEGTIVSPEGRRLTLAEAARLAREEGRPAQSTRIYTPPPTTPLGEPGDDHFAYGFATQAALVEVDLRSGSVRVLKVVAAHDVGRAINPQAVIGQLEGGVVMGMGYALSEELVLEEGQVRNADLRRYRLPRAPLIPEVIPILVEAHHSEGPFGAKGVGEITSIPTAPAITSAIYAAAGVRITRIPATPERVLEALGRLGPGPGQGDR